MKDVWEDGQETKTKGAGDPFTPVFALQERRWQEATSL